MTNKRSKKLGLLLVGILCFMILGSNELKSLHPFLETLEKDMNVRIAAIDNYKLDLTITWGGADPDEGYDISLDNSGNIYITGETSSFGEGNKDAFIVKYDSSGVQQWDTTWGGVNHDKGNGIAVDTSGNIYITGSTESFYRGHTDVFIAKYNNSGALLWNTTWGGIAYDYGYDIALDILGNIYITGKTSYPYSYSGAFIAKFNSLGVQQWNTTWDSTIFFRGEGIAVATSGNIYITGDNSGYGGDTFILKCDSSGAQQWNTTWGNDNEYNANDIALDNSENIYITGYIRYTSLDYSDAFIAKFNSSGAQQWNTTWAGDNNDFGNDITLDILENIYITGYTYSFGVGNGDVFIAKYNNSGALLWNTTWGGVSFDGGYGIALDSLGNIHITGSYGVSAREAFILRYLPSLPSDGETISFDLFFSIPIGIVIVVIIIYKVTLKKKQKN